MQRAYFVLFTGLTMLFQNLTASAAGYEYDGKLYQFRQINDGMNVQSSPASDTGNRNLSFQNEAQALKQLEDEGYVFKPLRKRKKLDDPPVANNAGSKAYQFQSCPTPVNPQAAQQTYQEYPTAPAMRPPQIGYPYTYPSQQNFPYPSGGFMPYPGGFGMPRW